jgi:hypothetical protein
LTKLILALHGSDLRSRLFTTTFRDVLTDCGATAVQINLDDEPVREALRFGPGQPITALVSVWLADEAGEAERQAVLRAVSEASGESDLHAYAVAERVRLDPAPVPDGVRADVYAQVALLRRPDHLTREQYLEYWQLRHTPIAIRTQNTSAYIQNIVAEPLTTSSPELAAVVEEHFPMAALADPHEFYGSRGDAAELDRRITELMASVQRFGADVGLDLVPTSRYQWALTVSASGSDPSGSRSA